MRVCIYKFVCDFFSSHSFCSIIYLSSYIRQPFALSDSDMRLWQVEGIYCLLLLSLLFSVQFYYTFMMFFGVVKLKTPAEVK